MSSTIDAKQRQIEDTEILFHTYLNEAWPGWRGYQEGHVYQMLRKAFFAGAGIKE